MRSRKQKQNNKNSRNENIHNSIALVTNDIMPPTIMRRLNYIDNTMTLTDGASPFLVRRFRANSVFDPDFALGGGTVAGFTELAALYRLYRVKTLEFEWTCSNNEDFPVLVGAFYTPIVFTVTSTDEALNCLENGYSTRGQLLSAKGGQDRITIRGSLDLHKLVGNRTVYNAAPEYGSLVSTSPSTVLFFSLIVVSTNGSNLTNGISTSCTLRYHTQLYDRVVNNA